MDVIRPGTPCVGIRIEARGMEMARLMRLILKVVLVAPWLLNSGLITYIPRPVERNINM